ncbi:amidohydrolase family protein [Pigmentiphaga soli]|uniref:Amidohydrolase family protein n=1 Tax=Pigmentiphaga soli TaxID=1007095 RepID=A0ABP8HPZ0_9BURK
MSVALPASIVDIHSHVIAGDPVRFPPAPTTGRQSDWSRERPVDAAAMIAAMDAAGVARSVLVQASTCYGHDNSYVVESVRARPDRFVGVFSADLTAPDAVDVIDGWMARGLSGLRVFVAGHTAADRSVRLDDPRAYPAWRHAAERRIPISVQIRADGLPQLAALLDRFPGVPVVLDHFARPALEDGPPYEAAAALFALARYDNLHFKLTTHNVREARQGRSTQAAFLRRAVDAFGAHRIAWGSNYPASPGTLGGLLGEALEAAAELSAQERAWIFGGTARALYPALGAA